MTADITAKVVRVLTTDDRVFGAEVDAAIRRAANRMTAAALVGVLTQLDLESPSSGGTLAAFVEECSLGDPSVLIGLDDGGQPQHAECSEPSARAEVSLHCLKIVHSSAEAAFYLFHAGRRVLDVAGVAGGSRKRAGSIHHVRVELSHPRHLTDVVAAARDCPHVIRVEESTDDEFFAAASDSV